MRAAIAALALLAGCMAPPPADAPLELPGAPEAAAVAAYVWAQLGAPSERAPAVDAHLPECTIEGTALSGQVAPSGACVQGYLDGDSVAHLWTVHTTWNALRRWCHTTLTHELQHAALGDLSPVHDTDPTHANAEAWARVNQLQAELCQHEIDGGITW